MSAKCQKWTSRPLLNRLVGAGDRRQREAERYTRAADQERLARRAIQRQSDDTNGKLPIDEVANTSDDALKFNSLMWKMALPGGLEPPFSP